MTTLLKVEGMSCSHCESRVVKYVSGMDGVSSAEASAKDGTVKVEHDGTVSVDAIKAVIDDLGYEVKD
nr:cation transporter [uncultured Solibaculum sp.]